MTPCDAVALELKYGAEVSTLQHSSQEILAYIMRYIIYLPSQDFRVGGVVRGIVEM